MKFQTKEDTLDVAEFTERKNIYIALAKSIDSYQKEKFREWSDKIMDKAMGFLKQKILIKESESQFRVNFSEEFKILIKEAKHLEKMGYPISKTLINISL